MAKEKLVHIYGQEIWHGDAFIVANKEGLLAISQAINQALTKGKGVTEVMPADGEGFALKILCRNDEWLSPFWDNLAMPYTDNVHYRKREAIYPWHLKELFDKPLT